MTRSGCVVRIPDRHSGEGPATQVPGLFLWVEGFC